VFCSFYVDENWYNVNIKILVCQIIGPAATASAEPVHIRPCWFTWKKVKLAHTRLPSVGFRSWSQFLAVSLQVTWVINPSVGCHYFPPGLQLSSQPLRGLLPVSLLGEQRHDGCGQLASNVVPDKADSVAVAIWTHGDTLLRLSRARLPLGYRATLFTRKLIVIKPVCRPSRRTQGNCLVKQGSNAQFTLPDSTRHYTDDAQ